jgi:hypothetical protein
MSASSFWKTPAWQTPIERADRVELLELPGGVIPHDGWPESFWAKVRERRLLVGSDADRVIRLFRELAPGEPARCHTPPWGLAFYEGEALLFTVSLCFACSNAYIYDAAGWDLRAFKVAARGAKSLRAALKQHLPRCTE